MTSSSAATNESVSPTGPWVILAHGLAAHRSVLWLIAWRLRRRGFRTVVFSYPSIRFGVKKHAQSLDEFLVRFEQEHPGEPYSLVAHSMGGILVRALLERRRPEQLQRIVMLGSPNQGSHAARKLAPFLGRICQPLHELADTPEALVKELSEPTGIPTAVIAGSRDRVVTVEATKLSTSNEHLVVRSGHGELLFRRDVVDAVERFLKTGRLSELPADSTDSAQSSITVSSVVSSSPSSPLSSTEVPIS